MSNFITYLGIIAFAILFIFFGNRIASTGLTVFDYDDTTMFAEARITRIVEEVDEGFSGTSVVFEAQITRGENRGETVTGMKILGGHYADTGIELTQGDNIVMTAFEPDYEWFFIDFARVNSMIFLGVAFVILLLFFGRTKGLSALLSLGFTCAAIFVVFIPSILSGKNIYISTIIVCVFSIVVTLFLLNGINKKSIAAVVGCLGGVLAAGVLTLIMSNVLVLTGMVDSDSRLLLLLPTENPVDLKAIIFAGIIIGASGAVMDVAVSISSALWELKRKARKLSFRSLFDSGINIGKDIMGSMTNTLVLAYIGSSLSVILILVVFVDSLTELLNMELVMVEILQAIVGSMGILLTMPLTALVCAFLFTRRKPKRSAARRKRVRPQSDYIDHKER